MQQQKQKEKKNKNNFKTPFTFIQKFGMSYFILIRHYYDIKTKKLKPKKIVIKDNLNNNFWVIMGNTNCI